MLVPSPSLLWGGRFFLDLLRHPARASLISLFFFILVCCRSRTLAEDFFVLRGELDAKLDRPLSFTLLHLAFPARFVRFSCRPGGVEQSFHHAIKFRRASDFCGRPFLILFELLPQLTQSPFIGPVDLLVVLSASFEGSFHICRFDIRVTLRLVGQFRFYVRLLVPFENFFF